MQREAIKQLISWKDRKNKKIKNELLAKRSLAIFRDNELP